MQLLDIIFKTATVLVAVVNLIFVVKFFNLKSVRDNSDKERDRKINWLKTLVLDYNLDSFYSFFDSLETSLAKLKRQNISLNDKTKVDEEIADLFILLRRKFTDTLLAVDDSLYKKVLLISDKLQTHLTETIFDNGVNLAHPPKFQELLLERLIISKTDIIKVIFGYRG